MILRLIVLWLLLCRRIALGTIGSLWRGSSVGGRRSIVWAVALRGRIVVVLLATVPAAVVVLTRHDVVDGRG